MRSPMRRTAVLLGTLALAGASLASQASGATIAVGNLSDSGPGSLRAAILSASPGDSITVPAGEITLTSGPLAISKSITITGAGPGASVISANNASRVLTITGAPVVALESLTVTQGNAEKGAGILAAGELTLRHVAVSGNHAGGGGTAGYGGGIEFAAGTLSLIESSVSANTAGGGKGGSGFGGGIGYEPPGDSTSFTLSLLRSSMTGNSAGGPLAVGFGGAIEVGLGTEKGQASISVIESDISANTAGGGALESTGFGGAISFSSGGSFNTLKMTLEGSSITGNSAGGGGAKSSGYGGGIEATSGGTEVTQSLIALNTTIAGNTSGGGGSVGYGAGLDFGPGTANLSSSTIVGNLSGSEREIIGSGLELTPTSMITDSIVAGNGHNCAEPIKSGGHNIDDGTTCGFTAAGDMQNTAPVLGPLAFNGGPTPTLVPQPGSPAIDAGASFGCPRTDQRGVQRPFGAACDIGAVEVAPPSVSTGPAASVTSTGAALAGSAGDPSTAAGTVRFQYGTGTSYGAETPPQALAAGVSGAQFSAALTGLAPHTTYRYRVLASTPDGTAYGADRSFATGLPFIPVITALSQSHRSWREGSRLAAISRARVPVGTKFSFRLSTPAKLALSFTVPAAGRLSGHSCLAPTSRNRHGRRCTRAVVKGAIALTGHAGSNTVSFQGTLSRGHRLARGTYTLVLTATDAYGQRSAPRNITFKITG